MTGNDICVSKVIHALLSHVSEVMMENQKHTYILYKALGLTPEQIEVNAMKITCKQTYE